MQTRPLVFLDIDGVLNNDAWLDENPGERFDPANIRCLNLLVLESAAEIVITSDWRKWFTWPELCSHLAASGIEGEFRDWTPVLDRDGPMGDPLIPRGKEIDAWLGNARHEGRFVILDDRDDMDPHQERLVLIDPEVGLSKSDVEQALRLLGA